MKKKPHLQYWFYAGTKEETGDRDKDGIIDVIDDTKDLIEIIKILLLINNYEDNNQISTFGKNIYLLTFGLTPIMHSQSNGSYACSTG